MRLFLKILRVLGIRRLVLFGTGIVVGLLLAPGPGAELRERLAQRLSDLTGGSDDEALADAVRVVLADSPRTWHLDPPQIEVVRGTVVLTGSVPHLEAKDNIERTVLAVPGVLDIDNRLVIDSPAHQ
jgi:hypothetical protein